MVIEDTSDSLRILVDLCRSDAEPGIPYNLIFFVRKSNIKFHYILEHILLFPSINDIIIQKCLKLSPAT